jgi:hypothetical protein
VDAEHGELGESLSKRSRFVAPYPSFSSRTGRWFTDMFVSQRSGTGGARWAGGASARRLPLCSG